MIFNPSSGGGSWCDFTPGDFTRSRSAKRRPKPLLSKSFLPQAACDLFQTLDWKLGIWSKHVKTNPPKKVSLATNPPNSFHRCGFQLEITQDLSPPIRKHRWSPSVTMVVRCLWLSIVVLLFQFFQDGILNVQKLAVKTVEKTGTCQITWFLGGQVLVGMGEWHPPAAGRLTNISLDSLGRGIISQRPEKACKSNTSISKHV